MRGRMESVKFDINSVDINAGVPANEVERQYYFMAKAKTHVDGLAQKLGRKPTCCVTTFGCPTV